MFVANLGQSTETVVVMNGFFSAATPLHCSRRTNNATSG